MLGRDGSADDLQAIVFLPAIGAPASPGLLGRVLGPRPCEIITTPFVGIGAVLSWIALWQVGFGGETLRIPVLRWVTSGELDVSWALRIDTLTAVMLVVVNTVSVPRAPLLHRLHARGRQPAALLRLPVACSPSPCWRW